MKKRKLLTAFILGLLVASCESNYEKRDFLIDEADIKESFDREMYSNNFSDEQIPNQWENYGIGDPFVYRFNGMYYLYVSTKNKQTGIRAYKSSDLVNWTECRGGGILNGYVSSEPCTLTAYAPEVIYFNGKFYMTESQGGLGHYMLESDSPEGPFVKTQDNFGQAIDGSFFLDDDEKMYFLNAGNSGIRILEMNDDMTVGTNVKRIESADIGGWTEGPYLLKKDGDYFLTFTGPSVTSPGYHIAYSYHQKDSESKMFSRDGFTFGNNVILSTDDEFKGLGHSSTVLGPNLDSYYIAYHSLESQAGPKRRFNIDRLMFNGTEMVCSYYGKENNPAPQKPEFVSQNASGLLSQQSFLLSSVSSGEIFSSEFNFKGNPKCIFGYESSESYSYVKVTPSGKVEIKQIKGAIETLVASYQLKRTYNFDKLHTFRVAYRDQKIDVYFDTMRIIADQDFVCKGGKIGYLETSNEDIFYTVMSNSAKDSSQQDDSKFNVILSNTFDRKYSTVTNNDLENNLKEIFGNGCYGASYLKLSKDKTATYKIYIPEDGYYGFDFLGTQESQGKTISLRIDNEDYSKFKLPSYPYKKADQDYLTSFGGAAIKKGIHYVTIKGDEGILLRSLNFYKTSTIEESFENSLSDFVIDSFTYVNTWKIKDNGHYSLSGNRQLLYIGDNTIRDCSVEVKIKFEGDTISNSCGIILRAGNPSFATADTSDSIQGYYVGLSNNSAVLRECNYNMSVSGASDSLSLPSGIEHTLKVEAKGNKITAYINGTLTLSYYSKIGLTHGYIGLLSDGCAAIYKDLKISISN